MTSLTEVEAEDDCRVQSVLTAAGDTEALLMTREYVMPAAASSDTCVRAHQHTSLGYVSYDITCTLI